MKVVIAIVGYRNAADIVRCLAALDRSAYARFEVIICENGGADAFAALADRLPAALSRGQPVRLVRAPHNVGFAGGVNICLAQTAQADAWWVLNPDTEPHAEALGLLMRRLERGDCDAVGCTLLAPDGRVASYGGIWRSWLARPESIGKGGALDQGVDTAWVERRQSYLIGAAMLVGRRFLDTVGPMREDYFLYCEEVEWCLRAQDRGMRLGFCPDSIVVHHQGSTTGAAKAINDRPKLPIYLGERNKILLTRDLFPHYMMVSVAAVLVLIVVRYARRWALRQLGFAISGWWAGFRDERGPPPWAPEFTGLPPR